MITDLEDRPRQSGAISVAGTTMEFAEAEILMMDVTGVAVAVDRGHHTANGIIDIGRDLRTGDDVRRARMRSFRYLGENPPMSPMFRLFLWTNWIEDLSIGSKAS
jgi:hypothetical protein